MVLQVRGSDWENRLWRLVVQVEEEVAEEERPVYYTGGKRVVQSGPGAEFGFEAGWRTAPSGCGTASPEAATSVNGEGMVQGSGQERRVMVSEAVL